MNQQQMDTDTRTRACPECGQRIVAWEIDWVEVGGERSDQRIVCRDGHRYHTDGKHIDERGEWFANVRP